MSAAADVFIALELVAFEDYLIEKIEAQLAFRSISSATGNLQWLACASSRQATPQLVNSMSSVAACSATPHAAAIRVIASCNPLMQPILRLVVDITFL